jgi:hypothetical protein
MRYAAPVLALVTTFAGACLMTVDEDRCIDCGTSGAPPAPQPLLCGNARCGKVGQVCCATTFSDTDYTHGVCGTSDGCATGDYFECESAADCPAGSGKFCCAINDPQGGFTRTECDAICRGARLCQPNEMPACPTGTTCSASYVFLGLNECQ